MPWLPLTTVAAAAVCVFWTVQELVLLQQQVAAHMDASAAPVYITVC
jgi:hypothetical protein